MNPKVGTLSCDCVLGEERVRIRTMQEADVHRAAELEAAAFSMPWSEAALCDMLKREDALYLVAENKQRVIGLCGVINACGDGDVCNVSVEASFRGSGIGTCMLEQLLLWGERIGIKNYTLEVRAGNRAAIHVYEKLGFREEGVRRGFYEKPMEDALIMWKRQETVG